MLTRRIRGAALVEYAVILACVTGLAGAGMKAIHGKAKTTAMHVGEQLASTGGGGGNSGGGSSASDARPSGGGGPSSTPSGGNGKPKPQQPKTLPKKLERKDNNDGDDQT